MKTLSEAMMVVGSLFFWGVALPIIFLLELGVLLVDKIDRQTGLGSAGATAAAH